MTKASEHQHKATHMRTHVWVCVPTCVRALCSTTAMSLHLHTHTRIRAHAANICKEYLHNSVQTWTFISTSPTYIDVCKHHIYTKNIHKNMKGYYSLFCMTQDNTNKYEERSTYTILGMLAITYWHVSESGEPKDLQTLRWNRWSRDSQAIALLIGILTSLTINCRKTPNVKHCRTQVTWLNQDWFVAQCFSKGNIGPF